MAAAASSVVGGLLSSSSPLGQQHQTRKCSFLSSQFFNDLPISLRPFSSSSSSSSSSSRRCTRYPRIRSSLQGMVSDMGRKAPKGLFPPEPEKYTGSKLEAAIIGAGLAGMSTAVELLDQGHEVDIYEARSFIGDKVGSRVDYNGNQIEMGLHVFFGWYNNLLRLLTKALRFLAALVLGFGVILSLRPGHALANVANEVFSPQGKGLLASAWAGLLAGGLHTLTGPDHLAALAPLCIGRSRIQSAAVGALWGCGHDAGQIIFGLIFLVLKDKLHIELIRTWASRVVGLTLITIGGVGIYESQEPVAVLAEESGMQDGGGDPTVRIKNDSKNATTFATGVVYGLQPDALLMILPALALPSRATGAAFLVMFLLGTILAMGSYTLFIASCSHALQKRLPGITKNLSIGSSIIAIALGLGLVASELFGFTIF